MVLLISTTRVAPRRRSSISSATTRPTMRKTMRRLRRMLRASPGRSPDGYNSAASAKTVATDGARAVQAALQYPGQIATLILPADTAWLEADRPAPALPKPVAETVATEAI